VIFLVAKKIEQKWVVNQAMAKVIQWIEAAGAQCDVL
jgi:hypothetical protein